MLSNEQFQLVMDQHTEHLFRIAYYYTKNVHVSQDIVQDTFVKYYTAKTYEHRGELKAFLSRITINLCKDYLKSWTYRKMIVQEKLLPQRTVIRQYGYHYTERPNKENRYDADTIYDYGTIEVYLRDDLIVAIENQHFYSVDFDDIYEAFLKRGFVEEKPDSAYVSSFYSKTSNQQIIFETNPNGTLIATLRYKISSE